MSFQKIKNKINDDKTESIVNNFIVQIYELDKSKKTLDDKINSINLLANNLIDFCIKKKIFYFIENKVSYSQIVKSFKTQLITFIKNLVDPANTIINKYIETNNSNSKSNANTNTNHSNQSNPNWDNVSDINSLMFKNFKNFNETFEKNVSFREKELPTQTNYDETFGDDSFEPNYKLSSQNINSNANSNSSLNFQIDLDKLGLYIKILINQNKYVVELVDKLISMCKILSDPDIKYKKVNPFE